MRFFLELRYNGAAYFGYQRQNDVPTVQGAIESALSMLLRAQIEIVGAGRTDTGVHAAYYVAHFDAPSGVEVDVVQLKYKLNVVLNDDIAIMRIAPVEASSHARFSATRRQYKYYIEREKNPFTRHTTWQYYVDLDIDKMNAAAAILLQHSDFTTFAKLNSNNTTNICTVYQAQWERLDDGRLCFTITANRFLRNMVRAIVGTLVDVGRGKYSVEQFGEIVESRSLKRASAGAPASGLFLSDVEYDFEF